ncbi:hypothetical protein ACSBL2_08195 [Pedobacter sp. AW31-3R]|uniref:hypothetical protein n=1 Tax=Pedobacter sp. AW31-3R TaxID=3445781 RepID=UPI003FA0CB40
MSYTTTRFEVEYKGQTVPVTIHTVTEGEETNHIVSLEDHENFEIQTDQDNQWKPVGKTEVNSNLLGLIIDHYKMLQA